MNLKGSFFGILIISILILASACEGLKGKKSDKKTDSLFLGISLGMEKKAFFELCTENNRNKIITQGPTNLSIEYKLNLTKSPVDMRFFPTFENDRVYELPVTFSYEAWAPWNRQYQSDSLLIDMVSIFKKWYGEDFQVIDHKTMGKIYARIDGKRRINLFIRDDQFVQAEQLKGKAKQSTEQPVNQ
jgi:hypothetical protein